MADAAARRVEDALSPRGWDRLAASLSIVLLVAVGGGAWYLAERAGADRGAAPAARPPEEPDAFVDRFALVRVDAQGRAAYRVEADRALHFPDDSTELIGARVVSLDPSVPRVTIRADRGQADPGVTQVRLDGDVVLTRAPDGKHEEMRIRTESAVVLVDPQVARTDQPVRITMGRSFLQGTGMEYDHLNRRLQVKSRVRGSWYDPDASPTTPPSSS